MHFQWRACSYQAVTTQRASVDSQEQAADDNRQFEISEEAEEFAPTSAIQFDADTPSIIHFSSGAAPRGGV